MITQKNPIQKTKVLFTRIEPRLLKTFEDEAEARGLTRCEATRQIICAWLRQPDALSIGIKPEQK